MSEKAASERIVVGKISGVYGVKGWVKIHSFTEPMDNILGYKSFTTKLNGRDATIEFDQSRKHGKAIVGHIVGVDDREVARHYTRCELSVPIDQLPELQDDEFYWYQLTDLKVYSRLPEGGEVLLGAVRNMLETGANDVLIVSRCENSLDDKERLIPYIPGQYVLDVDLEQGRMTVDWDPEF
ncbi:16S rRNA processing protein RimM [Sinobacterium caligoides]|jgi:16S rRNA processing protein RimM|uniref:Ribosome maturation factor RimM n=1 Tax=Sinobacterium caligoides TaxID=933926 RepID=A0A3N2DZY4_9GAMM|nr:ribosome maturation factor RimM [Sinobacterium caligoides]ROS05212.1 16S rRNA processing protein RimM [Sinobacterium caligoides]